MPTTNTISEETPPGTLLSKPVARGTSAEGAKYTAAVEGHAHVDDLRVYTVSNAACSLDC